MSVLQQARLIGATAIGTASARNFEVVRGFGGEPVAYGPGLVERVRAAAPGGVDAVVDTVGTDEAVESTVELLGGVGRAVTIVASERSAAAGIAAIAGALPESAAFRDAARSRLLALAAEGQLVVPVARTFPLGQAREALELVRGGHPGGKVALIPD